MVDPGFFRHLRANYNADEEDLEDDSYEDNYSNNNSETSSLNKLRDMFHGKLQSTRQKSEIKSNDHVTFTNHDDYDNDTNNYNTDDYNELAYEDRDYEYDDIGNSILIDFQRSSKQHVASDVNNSSHAILFGEESGSLILQFTNSGSSLLLTLHGKLTLNSRVMDFGGEGDGGIEQYRLNKRLSLELSILDEIQHNLPENERFKYLETYQKLYKRKHHEENRGDNDSVFQLSHLNDFDRYVKQTELNELIQQALRDSGRENILNVIPENELNHRFTWEDTKHRKQNGKGLPTLDVEKIKKPSNIWYNRDSKKNSGVNDIEELYFKHSNSDDTNSMYEQQLGEKMKHRHTLKRKLKVRHLQMISLGGTLGVGLLLNSGKAITIGGGLGAVLGFTITGIIVVASIVSFCEMVTFVSIVDGVSGLSSRFVDDAFGFAVGWLYWSSFAIGLAGEIVASVIMLTFYSNLKILEHKGTMIAFVILFLGFVVGANLMDVEYYGEIEYFSGLIKVISILLLTILMIVLNRGGLNNEVIGFKYWDHSQLDFENGLIYGPFRPSFNLNDNVIGSTGLHGGNLGRFLAVIVACLTTCYAYSGTEIVCIAACEANNPRKALPSATKRVFFRVLIFYILASFVVSLNLYAGDPRLLRYRSHAHGSDTEYYHTLVGLLGGDKCNTDYNSKLFAGFSNGSQSPWIVALQSIGACNGSGVVNALLVFFAVTCGTSQIYVSSRTVYSMSLQGKAPKILSRCNRFGTPYMAVLFLSLFGLLAFFCVSETATQVFQYLSSFVASLGIIVWCGMSLSFIRFYYGLQRRPDIMSRDDKSYPYRSPFQPYTAIVGFVGTAIIVLSMGFVVFLKGEWDVLFFFTSYGTLFLFIILYIGYRVVKGARMRNLESLDFDLGRREMDRYLWDGGREYNIRSFKDISHKLLGFFA